MKSFRVGDKGILGVGRFFDINIIAFIIAFGDQQPLKLSRSHDTNRACGLAELFYVDRTIDVR